VIALSFHGNILTENLEQLCYKENTEILMLLGEII
jgi:hypothetical protein